MLPSDKTFEKEITQERPGLAEARRNLYGDNPSLTRGGRILAKGDDRIVVENPQMQPYIRPFEMPQMTETKTAFKPNEQVAVPQKHKQLQLLTTEDLMPSIKTMRMLEDKPQKKEKVKRNIRLDKRSKIMIALYAAVVAVLAITIIISGIAVSKLNNNVSALESTYEQNAEIISDQQAELNLLDNDAVIKQKAQELGMVDNGGNIVKIELIEIGEPQGYAPKTNWFDKLCDWLSGIVGS